MRSILKTQGILILGVLFCIPSFAQNKVGNGGNAVVCQDGETEKARLLDFYEAGLEPRLSGLNSKEILRERLLTLLKIAPKLGEAYLLRLATIEKQIEFKKDVRLVNVDDSLHNFEPKDEGCRVRQAAIRKSISLKLEKPFIFDLQIWEAMPMDHQAGLIGHEIIYEHFSRLGETDSMKVRKLNALIFSRDPLTADAFWGQVQQLQLPIYP